jgi:hypothetical protein
VPGALLAAALLAACSSNSAATGPLGPSYSSPFAWQCVNAPVGQSTTIGDTDLTNSGTSPVTVVSVRLPPEARRVTMTEAWLLPDYIDPKNGDDDEMGSGWPFPPTARPNGASGGQQQAQ